VSDERTWPRAGTPGKGLLALVLVALLAVGIAGCESLGFYRQAVSGQLTMLWQRQDVAALLADPDTPAPLRQQLSLSQAMLDWAEAELALEAGGQYRQYVDLDRDAAVYVVFAAEEFSLTPVSWCYPFVGCLAYRGYFERERAVRLQDALLGKDTHVASVAAYSTLGWFRDPLLSTFIYYPEADLAGLLFHELAHVRLFLAGDTAFNESYASLLSVKARANGWRRTRMLMHWLRRSCAGDARMPSRRCSGTGGIPWLICISGLMRQRRCGCSSKRCSMTWSHVMPLMMNSLAAPTTATSRSRSTTPG
jgi:predicted aminopeptidase